MRIEVDVDGQVDDVTRMVGRRVLDGDEGEAMVLTISQAYDTDLADLWEAVTDAERIARWFLPVTGELRLGGRYQLEGNAGGVIQACDPPHGFDATWEYGEGVSWIEVRLVEEGEGRTRFTLHHIAEVDDATWEQYGPGAVGIGWDQAVLGFALHIRSGSANDAREFMGWTATPEGIRFTTRVGEAWHDADVNAGADPAEARARADRTIEAYTSWDPTAET
jgi:uncharacterized protein YndB with AHSA1/START domain